MGYAKGTSLIWHRLRAFRLVAVAPPTQPVSTLLLATPKQLAFDYAPQGLHVNAIAPGAIATPMNAADFAGEGAMAKQVAAQTSARRWATAQEVADLTFYLTSPLLIILMALFCQLMVAGPLGH